MVQCPLCRRLNVVARVSVNGSIGSIGWQELSDVRSASLLLGFNSKLELKMRASPQQQRQKQARAWAMQMQMQMHLSPIDVSQCAN